MRNWTCALNRLLQRHNTLGTYLLVKFIHRTFFPSASSLCVSVATTSTSIWLAVHWLPLYHILPFIRFAFFRPSRGKIHFVFRLVCAFCRLRRFVLSEFLVHVSFSNGLFDFLLRAIRRRCVCGSALQKIVLHSKMDKDFCFACNKLLRYLTTEFGPVVIVILLPSNYHHDPVEVVDQRLVVCVRVSPNFRCVRCG